MRYLIVIEQTDSGSSAGSPDLPGCIAKETSLEACQNVMQEAMQFHIEGLRKEGLKVPQPSSRLAYVEIAA